MGAEHRGLVVGLLAIVTCTAFEAMAVATAMPVVADELHGRSSYGLAFSMYLTASLVATASAGVWCDLKGPRPSLLTGLVLMCSGLVVSGAAADFTLLTLGRMVSGLGGGFLIVPLYVIIGQALPPRLQPTLFGWFSAAWVVPSLVGPYIAGLLAEHVSWRWVFFGVAPFVLGAVGLVWSTVRRLGPPAEPSTDPAAGGRRALLGLVLAVGVFAGQWAAHDAAGGAGAWSLLLGAAGLAAVVLAAPRLLPAGTFRLRRGLPSVVVARGLLTLAFFGAEAFVPLMLVSTRGIEPSAAGLALTGGAVGWTLGSVTHARIRRGKDWMLRLAPVLLAVTLSLMALAAWPSLPGWIPGLVWVGSGFAMGVALSRTSVLVLELSNEQDRGRNSASLQLADMLGGVIGTAGAGTVYALLRNPIQPSEAGVYVVIWAILAFFAALAAVAGFRIPGGAAPVAAGSDKAAAA